MPHGIMSVGSVVRPVEAILLVQRPEVSWVWVCIAVLPVPGSVNLDTHFTLSLTCRVVVRMGD